jgi:hypothetical protein
VNVAQRVQASIGAVDAAAERVYVRAGFARASTTMVHMVGESEWGDRPRASAIMSSR